MTFGALMAGLRAGSSHNTFPTMSGYWIPPGLFDLQPWWINPFENGTTVQFIHRWIATLLALGVLAMAIRTRKPETLVAGGVVAAAVLARRRDHRERRGHPHRRRASGGRSPAPDDPARGAPSRRQVSCPHSISVL